MEVKMKEIIQILAGIVNNIHDILISMFGIQMTDKALHFWVIGIIGMVVFIMVYICFKVVEKIKWSTTALSFIYTFTIVVILVFAIELQQAITKRGNMEFSDAVAGLYGFLVFFAVYAIVALIVYFLVKKFNNKQR